MADMMTFELVSPERKLASVEAAAVTVPGQEGDLTAMANHAPFLTTLRPGFVAVDGGSGGRYFVTGGFAEISNNSVSVLAEEAVEADKLDSDWMAKKIADAERALEDAGGDRAQAAMQRLNDFKAVASQI